MRKTEKEKERRRGEREEFGTDDDGVCLCKFERERMKATRGKKEVSRKRN